MRRLALLLALLIAPSLLSAQTIVSGTVKDADSFAYSYANMTITGGTAPLSFPIRSDGTFTVTLNGGTYTFSAFFGGIAPPIGTGPQTCIAAGITVSGSTFTVPFTCSALTNISSGGGGGGSPAGNNGDIQIRSGASFGTGGPGGSTANVGVLGNIAAKNFSSDGICYASTNGNDSNDGLSWGTAKLTIRGCLVSLPGGSTSPDTTGKGTVYFTDNTSAHPTSGCGIWLMGSTDPNYSSPPTCWIKNPGGTVGLTLDGIPQGNYGVGPTLSKARIIGGNSADINHPCLWISGVNTQMVFENMQCNFQGRPIVVGEDSNHSRAGENDGGSSGITFINVGAAPQASLGDGPPWDIVGGSFWINFSYCFGEGLDAVNAPTNNNAAAFLFDGTGNDGIGEIYLDHVSATGGGIKVTPGTVNPSVQMFEADHIEGESLHAPALVWFTGQMNAAGVHDVVANDSIGTLCNGGVCAIRNDGTIADNLAVGGALVGSGLPSIQGPMIEVGGAFDLVGQPSSTVSFLRQGLRGVIGSHLIGTTDASRRQFGPTIVRFVNAALSPSSYVVIPGTTLTQNVADPSGGTAATRLTATGPGEGVYISSQSGITVNVGDWFVFGAWVHSFTGNGYATSGNPISIGLTSCTTTQNTYSFGGDTPSPPYGGDGQWDWIVAAVQIATVSGGACQPNINVSADSTHTIDVFSPVYFHILASGAPSANEMLEVANNLQAYSNTCTVAQLCDASGAVGTGITGLTPQVVPMASGTFPFVQNTSPQLDVGLTHTLGLTFAGSGGFWVPNGGITAGGHFTDSSIASTTECAHFVSNVLLPTSSGDCATGGTVTSVALTTPSWLTVGGSPITSSGTLAVTPTTGETPGEVIGTCGSATTFAPCNLVATDLPATAVTPGSYTSVNITVDQQGRITAVANGAGGGTVVTIASGTAALGTSAIPSATCATVVTATATGTLTTDDILADFNADPTAVVGYIPSASGMLTIIKYPTAGFVNFKVCNNTAASITPGAVTLNWRVLR